MFTVWNHVAAAQPFPLSSSPFRLGLSPSLHRKVVLVSLGFFSLFSVISTWEKKSIRQDCIKETVKDSLTSSTPFAGEGVEDLSADWYMSSQIALWRDCASHMPKSSEHKSAQWSAWEDGLYFTVCHCEGEKPDCLYTNAPVAVGLLAAVQDSHHVAPECQGVC